MESFGNYKIERSLNGGSALLLVALYKQVMIIVVKECWNKENKEFDITIIFKIKT